MPIQSRAADAEFLAKVADAGVGLSEGGLGEVEFRGGHHFGAATRSASRAGGGQACFSSLDDEFSLEFGEGSEDTEDEFAAGRTRVDVGPLARQDAEADTSLGEVLHGGHEMTEVSTQAVEFPHKKRVTMAKCFDAGGQTRAIILLARGSVLIVVFRTNAGGDECIPLEVRDLAPIRSTDPHVTDKHLRLPSGCFINERF